MGSAGAWASREATSAGISGGSTAVNGEGESGEARPFMSHTSHCTMSIRATLSSNLFGEPRTRQREAATIRGILGHRLLAPAEIGGTEALRN